jgi:membrane associated rhomboid family serine protease
MFPLYDEERKKRKFPLMTVFLIFLNFLIFFYTFFDLQFFIEKFGLIPNQVLKGKRLFTFFSSMFLHGSFSHLFGNMWFLWIFGDNVEHKLKRLRFLLLYFFSGIGSALLYSFTASNKNIPVVGASGAISGILAAYLIFFPKNRIFTLVPFFYFYRILAIPAVFYIGFWFLYQFLYIGTDPFVAYWGHIGGFLTGLLALTFLNKK